MRLLGMENSGRVNESLWDVWMLWDGLYDSSQFLCCAPVRIHNKQMLVFILLVKIGAWSCGYKFLDSDISRVGSLIKDNPTFDSSERRGWNLDADYLSVGFGCHVKEEEWRKHLPATRGLHIPRSFSKDSI